MNVNNHIDMKNHKLINLDDANASNDAVNKRQLNAVETQVTSQVTTVNKSQKIRLTSQLLID